MQSTPSKKLKKLIQGHNIKFGCSVRVRYVTSSAGIGIDWRNTTKHGRHLWTCDILIPNYDMIKDQVVAKQK